MPVIEFLQNPLGGPKCVEVPEGGALLDICDELYAPIPFSCRSATCGTCHIDVVEGGECLDPPGEQEQELLDLMSGPPGSRLACQAQVKPGSGILRIRPV